MEILSKNGEGNQRIYLSTSDVWPKKRSNKKNGKNVNERIEIMNEWKYNEAKRWKAKLLEKNR